MTKSFEEVVNSDEFKQALVRVINYNVDIPFCPENIEEKIFSALVDSMLYAYKEYTD